MVDPFRLLQEIMTVTSNVGALRSDVDKLLVKVENNSERIIKLEQREDLLKEQMANHALQAVSNMNFKYFDRLSKVEQKLESLSPPATKKLPV